MLKIRQIILLCTLVALCACNSDKKRIQTYIDNFHPDSEIELDGDVVVDSTFCPLAALDSASLVLLSHRMNLLSLLDVNPDSAFALARQLNQKYNDSSFANIAYPKGPNNCLSYQVKCVVDGRERYVVFFKNANEDVIESSSIEVDEAVDSLMSSFTMLRNGSPDGAEGRLKVLVGLRPGRRAAPCSYGDHSCCGYDLFGRRGAKDPYDLFSLQLERLKSVHTVYVRVPQRDISGTVKCDISFHRHSLLLLRIDNLLQAYHTFTKHKC